MFHSIQNTHVVIKNLRLKVCALLYYILDIIQIPLGW